MPEIVRVSTERQRRTSRQGEGGTRFDIEDLPVRRRHPRAQCELVRLFAAFKIPIIGVAC